MSSPEAGPATPHSPPAGMPVAAAAATAPSIDTESAVAGGSAPAPPRRRFMLAAPVLRRAVRAEPQSRAPTPADAGALGDLLLAAHRGTIDDEGETAEAARALADDLFAGRWGAMMWSVSELTERDGRPVAAAMVTVWEGLPFVAFVVTDPACQREGLARGGLTRAINRLAAGDETVVRLVVTQGNARAEALYESLGFRPEARGPFEGG